MKGTKDNADRGDLLRGALEMLVLRTLAEAPMHGFGITEALRQRSNTVLTVDEGSMYPALYRMQRRGWIAAQWGRSENNRRAKFYALTDDGRQHLEAAADRWNRFSDAVSRVMDSA